MMLMDSYFCMQRKAYIWCVKIACSVIRIIFPQKDVENKVNITSIGKCPKYFSILAEPNCLH